MVHRDVSVAVLVMLSTLMLPRDSVISCACASQSDGGTSSAVWSVRVFSSADCYACKLIHYIHRSNIHILARGCVIIVTIMCVL